MKTYIYILTNPFTKKGVILETNKQNYNIYEQQKKYKCCGLQIFCVDKNSNIETLIHLINTSNKGYTFDKDIKNVLYNINSKHNL